MVLNAPLKQSQLLLSIHRCGNQGRRGSSCSPNLNKKSQKFPSFWDFAPEPRTNCMLRIPFSKNTYCIKLYFEFHCLAFSPIFASPTEKSFNFCSRTYVFIFCCRLKSHLFSLSYPAFWLFSHLYRACAVTRYFWHYNLSNLHTWSFCSLLSLQKISVSHCSPDFLPQRVFSLCF